MFLIFFILIHLLVGFIFTASCIVTLSDAQGGMVFILALPLMILMLLLSWYFAHKWIEKNPKHSKITYAPKFFLALIILFFISLFIPQLNSIPNSVFSLIGKNFEKVTGKSPYTYFRDRKSIEVLIQKELKHSSQETINFHNLDVTFAWDQLCLFGPYTNNDKAKSILHLEWKIEDHSQIGSSDSINTLVFLFEGKVNKVVELKRSILDFKDLDICLKREETNFSIKLDPHQRKILSKVN